MASDKHLDAEWKRIQKKTFTRWCNEHIKVQNMRIDDLTTDLSDGVRLIVLLEVLSQKKLGRYNKKPRVHAQRMENVQLALDFIMKKERIRLVNIGKSVGVVCPRLKVPFHMVSLCSRTPGHGEKVTNQLTILPLPPLQAVVIL